MTLDQIALTTNTDKSTRLHAYTPVYDALFAHLRGGPVRLLEIGILGGDSLRMWAQYFVNSMSTIVGVDIHDRGFAGEDPRILTIYGDAGSAEFLKSLPGPFSIVIDDGSHFWSHQILSFEMLWPQVAPGGFWICEDIHCIHSQQHRDAHIHIIDYFARIAADMQDGRGADGSAAPNPMDHWYSIESITVRKGLVIVRKRA